MDFTRLVNNKSDFDVILHVVDSKGKAVGFPAFDFILTFSSNGQGKFEAGQASGIKRGVLDENGDIRVIFDNHKLIPGVLRLVIRANVEDALYPDGKKLYEFSVPTNITLTSGPSEVSTGLKIDVKLPFEYQAPAENPSESETNTNGNSETPTENQGTDTQNTENGGSENEGTENTGAGGGMEEEPEEP